MKLRSILVTAFTGLVMAGLITLRAEADGDSSTADSRPSMKANHEPQAFMSNPQATPTPTPALNPLVVTAFSVPQQSTPPPPQAPAAYDPPPPVQRPYIPPAPQKKGRGPFHHLVNFFKSLAGVE